MAASIWMVRAVSAAVMWRPDVTRAVCAATWTNGAWMVEPPDDPVAASVAPLAIDPSITVTVRDGYVVAETPTYAYPSRTNWLWAISQSVGRSTPDVTLSHSTMTVPLKSAGSTGRST